MFEITALPHAKTSWTSEKIMAYQAKSVTFREKRQEPQQCSISGITIIGVSFLSPINISMPYLLM